MQASLVAFERSEGACRPYASGPFPASDCDVQCRISGLDEARWPGQVAPEPCGRPPPGGARARSRLGSQRFGAMGTGASAAKGMATAVNEMDEQELNAVVEKLDTETCEVIQKAINGKLGSKGSEMKNATGSGAKFFLSRGHLAVERHGDEAAFGGAGD